MSKSEAAANSQTLTRELIVQNKMGIHARPAAMVVRITNKFKADVMVEKDDEQVNGKSIMGLMMLAAGQGLEGEVHRERRRRRRHALGARGPVRPQVRRSLTPDARR
jgi:phosphotransferase system HPr (HPr) family protein